MKQHRPPGPRALAPLILLAVSLGSTEAEARQQPDSRPPPPAESVRAMRLLGEALQKESSLPGLAVAVGDETGIVFSEAFGLADLETRAPATPMTRWRVGSVGKSFTAVGMLLLSRRGALDLDAPVSTLLPSWRGRPAGEATPRQLAGHLGGVRHYADGEYLGTTHYGSVTEALELFADDPLVAPPGEEYHYSTHGYTLLSAVMERASDRPFLEWMEHELFRTAGMRHTGPDLVTRIVPGRASFYEISQGRMAPATFTDNSYKWAGGGFLSTPEDMVRFGRTIMDSRLVDPSQRALLFTSQRTRDGEETGYGMGFRPRSDWEGRRVVHHGGSSEGGRAFLLLYPEERVVVALAGNRSTAPLFEEEAQALAHFLLDHGPNGDGTIDRELTGSWALEGTLGDDPVSGSLRLHGAGAIRGILAWTTEGAPIRIILADRHGEGLLLWGVGPHGVMYAPLERDGEGWSGAWEYLGREGALSLRQRP